MVAPLGILEERTHCLTAMPEGPVDARATAWGSRLRFHADARAHATRGERPERVSEANRRGASLQEFPHVSLVGRSLQSRDDGGGLVHHTLPHGGDLVVVSACSESAALGSPSQSR